MQKVVKIIVLIFISVNYLYAGNLQDSQENINGYWLGLGIGGNYFGPNLCANLTFATNQHLFTIKYSKADEFQFAAGDANFDEPSLAIKEYAILYGRYKREKILLLSFSIGISYIKGINRGSYIKNHDYEKIDISTFGIPVEAEAMLEFTNSAGIGFLFYGNINKEKIFGGGMLRIKIGWFQY